MFEKENGVLGLWKQRSAEWQIENSAACFGAVLPDGTTPEGIVARRKVNGEWQYRNATTAEIEDYVSREAW